MSDEKTYTEREMAHERQAVARTVLLAHTTMGYEECDAIARQSFPLPKVTRPRVVRRQASCIEFRWRLLNGALQWANVDDDDWSFYSITNEEEWRSVGPIYVDLIANPTEEVDA